MPQVLHREPFSPILLDSPALLVTPEQDLYVQEILSIGASDSAFAKKMYAALVKVLTGGSVVPPVVTSLSPASAVLTDPPFILTVGGTGFTAGSVIQLDGVDQVTTFTSDTELATTSEITPPVAAGDVVVTVLTDGVSSDPLTLSFTDPVALSFGPMKKLTVEDQYFGKGK
jgi:hypothetical protein